VFVKNISECAEFTANDGCRIKEWLHPKNDAVDLPYSVAMATVDVGEQSYKHKLEQAEVYLITSGDAIYIEPERTQWIENNGQESLCFIALVNPPWSEEGDLRVS
jgi:mannose-6-phosphate isomerase-like protein (cupin superfamily)